jgi:hypothetical protein
MKWNLDRNLFTQVGLDSGALTILGSVIHSFPEPGEYRGSVHVPGGEQAVFYLDVDKESPTASVKIDLASLAAAFPASAAAAEGECCCEGEGSRFSVNPKGYVVFHVSQGSGGYSVHVRRAREDKERDDRDDDSRGRDNRPKNDREERVFNSQELGEGDFFATSIIRPGTYKVLNPLTKAEAQVVVAYPEVGKTPYRPPDAARVQVRRGGFEPKRVELKPGQGLIFDIQVASRILVQLTKPDDGPGTPRPSRPRGWSKQPLLAEAMRKDKTGQPDKG